ncbi:MAG: beta-glucosidase [Kofleriaceae bacterium]
MTSGESIHAGSSERTAFALAVERVARGGSADAEARALVDQLTLDEQLWLLDGDVTFWRGVVEYARFGYGQLPAVAGALPRLGIPGVRFADGPRGVVLGSSTCFPVSMARGATWDPALEERIGEAIGLEARAQGANYVGAPCVNLLRHPAWGRAQETYGEDPVHLGAMGAAMVRGLQRHVMACVKHYAVNSMDNARFRLDVKVDDAALHEVYLAHFKTIIDAGVASVMSAYNAVNGEWCGDSPTLLTKVLRDEWKFDGFVISDFLWGMHDPVGSLKAGLDIEMPFHQQRAAALPDAIERGVLSTDDVVKAGVRIIATQLRHAARITAESPAIEVVACDRHRALAREAGARAMVLLRNEPVAGKAVLPLDPAALKRLAVLGPLATMANLGDRGSSNLHPPATTSPLAGIQAALPGVEIAHEADDVARAAGLAASCDAAVVVVGHRALDEGEYLFAVDDVALALMPWPMNTRAVAKGVQWLVRTFERRGGAWGGDRQRLTLNTADEDLIDAIAAVNPRTIVVVVAGSAVVIESWRTKVPAIVLGWYAGMEGGHALADVLTGRVEPGGRLPFVIPTSEAHLPAFDRGASTFTYDRWYGYRKLDRDGHAAAFPFGFGLGYTTFKLSGLEILDETARVRVTNVGDRGGGTVVQLYAVRDGRDARADERPRRQLIGFSRVELGAGESTSVAIAWSKQPLSRRDPITKQWSLLAGDYRFEVGQFAGDLAATARVTL